MTRRYDPLSYAEGSLHNRYPDHQTEAEALTGVGWAILRLAEVIAESTDKVVATLAAPVPTSGDQGGETECCASGRCEVCTPGYVWGQS